MSSFVFPAVNAARAIGNLMLFKEDHLINGIGIVNNYVFDMLINTKLKIPDNLFIVNHKNLRKALFVALKVLW